MATYTVTTNADEDAAIEWMAEQAGTDAITFFDDQVHGMLNGWVTVYRTDQAPSTPTDVANAYAAAPLADQQQVVDILNTPLKAQP